MPLWRIRITLSDDSHSRALLNQALAGQRVSALNFTPREPDSSEMAGDVVLELPRDGDLGTMLSALHHISPRVFVSRVADDGVTQESAASGDAAEYASGEASPLVAAD